MRRKQVAKKASSRDKTVTRITTSESEPAKKVARPKDAVIKSEERRNPFAAFIGYFVGAWKELRQVRWPNRRATWSLTLAVLAFSGFFVAFILILDAIFKYLFELLLK